MPSEIAFLHGVRDRVPSEIAFPLLTATVYVHSTVNKPSQYNWMVHGAVNVLSHIHDSNSIREQAHNALLRKMDGGGDVGDFDVGDLWSDGEGDEVGPRPTHDGGMDTMSMEQGS